MTPETLDPKTTILGAAQREWLKSSLVSSPARWNVLAQQVMFAMVDFTAGDGKGYYLDGWPRYANDRMSLMKFIADRKISNPVVLTGDIHANWVNDLRVDDRKPETPVVATEFIGTSITSGGDGMDRPPNIDQRLAENPFVKFFNRQRGYVRCTVTPTEWRSDYMTLDFVSRPGGTMRTRASFVVESGKPGGAAV
jgi:alkaline phosphatase D